MERIFAMCALPALIACAGPSVVTHKTKGEASQIRSVEVSSAHRLSLRTTSILEASRLCRTEGKRARIVDVNPTGVTPFSLHPEAEVIFRCA